MANDRLRLRLLDELSPEHCPICKILSEDLSRYLDGFLYENVNDPGLRRQLRSAGGFCPFHAWSLKQLGDPLAHAIIYSDLLAEESRKLTDDAARHRQCPICAKVSEYERMYIEALAGVISDAKSRDQLKSKGFLCAAHFELAFKRLDAREKEWAIAHRQALIANVAEALEATKRAFDYRFSKDAVFDPNAWTQAIELMEGSEKLRYGGLKRMGLSPTKPTRKDE